MGAPSKLVVSSRCDRRGRWRDATREVGLRLASLTVHPTVDLPRVSVNAYVMAPDELGRRVAQARRELEASGAQANPRVVEGSEVGQSVEHLVLLLRRQREPQLEQGVGVRGWLVFIVKRAVRRMTRWYVEPRWIAEAEYDAELVRLATDAGMRIETLARQVAQLEECNGRLLREIRRVDRAVRSDEVS